MPPRGLARSPPAFFAASSGPAASSTACCRAFSWLVLPEVADGTDLAVREQFLESLDFGMSESALARVVIGCRSRGRGLRRDGGRRGFRQFHGDLHGPA